MKIEKKYWFRIAVLLLLLACWAVPVSAKRNERLIGAWRPEKFVIDLRFDEKLSTLTTATTTITVRILQDNTREIDLDFGQMAIDRVEADGGPAEYHRGPDRLFVTLPRAKNAGATLPVTVTYHGRPADGLIFSHDRDEVPTVVGDNWPDRAHNWIPCLDHPSAKAPVSFTITAPDSDIVVANGAEVGDHKNIDRTITWTFNEPAPVSPYNMIVGVAPFAHDALPGTTPLSWYVPRYDSKYAPDGFAAAPVAVQQFAETVAPFPYPKLALVIGATKFGGMENAGAIVFPTSLLDNFATDPREGTKFNAPRRVIDVVAHETAHQWFGDSVTEATWADLWLSEGFATYFAGLFRERTEGKESFRAYMNEAATKYFAYERSHRTPIHDTETESLMELLNPNNYEKGAWVLHMLRSQLGDEKFFAGIRAYYADHRGGVATSEDLRAALERSSGQDLRAFFARWVYGTGHPVYRVFWQWVKGNPGRLRVEVDQIQTGDLFTDPVPLKFTWGGKVERKYIKPTDKTTVVVLPFGLKPDSVEVDPDGTLLQEATVAEIKVRAVGR